MVRFQLWAVAALTTFVTFNAQAYIELNAFYSSDAISPTAGSGSSSRTNYEGALGFSIDKDSRYLVGWGYANFASADQAVGASDTSYASTQMGPRFVFNFDKAKKWSAALAYYVVTKATYKPASGTSEEWKGTALKFDFGYNFEVTPSFFIGVRGNYSSASYSDKFVGAAWTATSQSKTSLYPSIYSIIYF